MRPYKMQARQQSIEETRRRITEATMALHERVGPAATTVSSIAEEAGVTRLTVYRHFPDEATLVAACSEHWSGLHPRPETEAWAVIPDPELRVRTALQETYAWARTAAPMMTKIHRDVDVMPAFVAPFLAQEAALRIDVLAAAFRARGRSRRRLTAALAHALHILTWQSLCADGGLRDDEAVDLMTAMVFAAVRDRPRRS
jgi:AcrR family transcriptional regulator